MFDSRLQPILRRTFVPIAARLAENGVTADAMTIGGFAMGVAAAGAVALAFYKAALILFLLNRLADGLDGALARRLGPTDRGAFLDVALDFFFYALIPASFAFADPERNALAGAALLLAFTGTGGSFLAFAAVAGGRRMKAAEFPTKGLYYLSGLTEGAETIAFFIATALWPLAFPPLAYAFATLCFATTLMRWRWGWIAFAPEAAPASGAISTAMKGNAK